MGPEIDCPDSRRSVLRRGVSLLEAFAPGESALSLAELSVRTGLPKPTVHRLAGEMVLLGLLRRCDEGYELGLTLFELGARARRPAELRDAAIPYLTRVYELTRQVVNLAVLDGSEVVYIERLQGRGEAPLTSHVGGRLPAHATALGKAMLAFPSVPRQPGAAGSVPGSADGPRGEGGLAGERGLPGELASIAAARVAYERDPSRSRTCIAAPVLDRYGAAVAALSVTAFGPVRHLDRVADLVRTAAGQLGRDYRVRAERRTG